MEKVGFIGLGVMGKPMAKNLLRAGYRLVAYDLVGEAVDELVAAGAERGTSCSDVAARSDIIITMLPNSPEVEQAVLGEGGVVAGAKRGSIVVDMSSIAPLASREIAARLAERGIAMLDAPVSGGEPKAIEGTLAIMVGGEASVFERVLEVLGKMGATVTHVGAIGSGNVAKLANQIIVGLNIAAVSEAMVLATSAGVDPARIFQAIRAGLAGSTVLEAKLPLMLARNFKPGFRLELHVKDLKNATETARELGVPSPLATQALGMMQSLVQAGHGKDDHGGLVQYYEKLAEIEVKALQ